MHSAIQKNNSAIPNLWNRISFLDTLILANELTK